MSETFRNYARIVFQGVGRSKQSHLHILSRTFSSWIGSFLHMLGAISSKTKNGRIQISNWHLPTIFFPFPHILVPRFLRFHGWLRRPLGRRTAAEARRRHWRWRRAAARRHRGSALRNARGPRGRWRHWKGWRTRRSRRTESWQILEDLGRRWGWDPFMNVCVDLCIWWLFVSWFVW